MRGAISFEVSLQASSPLPFLSRRVHLNCLRMKASMRLPHTRRTQPASPCGDHQRLRRYLIAITVIAAFFPSLPLLAGPYSDSAHGNATYGVKRTSPGITDYARGNCAHCHELKGSVNGSEPLPVDGAPSPSALFYGNNVSQTDNVCLQCHTDASSYQSGGIVNRSYSYRAGAWTLDTVDDIKQAFSFLSPATSHNLNDILTFIKTKTWGYTTNSNPCVACHNPHAAKGDPANAGGAVKSAGTRGTPISLPSLHTSASGSWGLWGDVASETMSTYTTYQAPYRYNSAANLEPQGDTVVATAAQNTTNYVIFCTNCHNATNTIYSTTLGRNLRTINWDNEKHGKGVATPSGKGDGLNDLVPPYTDGNLGTYVLSCLDCHEPHGSSNAYLLRPEVNGASGVTVTTLTGAANGPGAPATAICNKEWTYLCAKCHTRLGPGNDGYHLHANPGGSCDGCHPPGPACYFIACGTCHFHGSVNLF